MANKTPSVSLVVDGNTFPLFGRIKEYKGGKGINANGVIVRDGVRLYVSINCAPSHKKK